jgi:hypothetical protein
MPMDNYKSVLSFNKRILTHNIVCSCDNLENYSGAAVHCLWLKSSILDYFKDICYGFSHPFVRISLDIVRLFLNIIKYLIFYL